MILYFQDIKDKEVQKTNGVYTFYFFSVDVCAHWLRDYKKNTAILLLAVLFLCPYYLCNLYNFLSTLRNSTATLDNCCLAASLLTNLPS